MRTARFLISFMFFLILLAGCRAPHELLETGELERADITAEEFTDMIPDYSQSLETLTGNGRAFISQPGNSDRISVDFFSDRNASLVTFRNRIGIEGGQLLVKDDSVLVYNRIDQIAEKISLRDANLTEVGTLATINLVELFHYPLEHGQIAGIYQDEDHYVGITENSTRITIDKETGFIMDIQTHPESGAPYSRINYQSYELIEDFYLPRNIAIFSPDGDIRVTLLVRQLQINRELPDLEIRIPDEIPLIIL